jgi:hypothetical protein
MCHLMFGLCFVLQTTMCHLLIGLCSIMQRTPPVHPCPTPPLHPLFTFTFPLFTKHYPLVLLHHCLFTLLIVASSSSSISLWKSCSHIYVIIVVGMQLGDSDLELQDC